MNQFSGPCVVGYHYPCLDGIFAALIAREGLKTMPTTLRFVPLNPSHPPTVDSLGLAGNETLFLLDFAASKSFVEELTQRCRMVVYIDHHVTAWNELKTCTVRPQLQLNFSMEMCAATLTLAYFDPILPDKIHKFLEFVEDSDLWRMALPETPFFRAGMGALNLNFDAVQNPGIFDTLKSLNLDDVLRTGRQVHGQETVAIDDAMRSAFKIWLGGKASGWGQCLAVEGTQFGRLRSSIGNKLAERSMGLGLRAIGAVAYADPHLNDSSKLKLSLRSLPSEDTTQITVQLGGGGHQCASSCVITAAEFRQWRA